MRKSFVGLMLLVVSTVSLATVEKSNFQPQWLANLERLTNVDGPSGFEGNVRKLIKKDWQQSASRVEVDGLGNVFGFVNKQAKGPNVLLMAHMDEVGFMVESILEEGYLKVIPLGGISDNVILGQRWVIRTPQGVVKAYSGLEAVHIMPRDKREKVLGKKAMFLDIGATSKQDAIDNFHIRPGLPVSPDSQLTKLSNRRYLAKALDDRLGLAAISEVANALNNKQLPNNFLLAATVEEEIGLRGASTVYASTKPDVAINVEIGIADDFPLLTTEKGSDIQLGKGPTLFVYDRSMIPNQALLQWIADLATKNGIPFQYEVEQGYGEDGAQVQSSGQGVPAINLGIPVRYAHEHAGVFDTEDFENAVKLLKLIVENLDKETVNKFRG